MAAIDSLITALQKTYLALFTPTSLLDDIAEWLDELPYDDPKNPHLLSGLRRLQGEPVPTLTAWLAGGFDWMCLAEDSFALHWSG